MLGPLLDHGRNGCRDERLQVAIGQIRLHVLPVLESGLGRRGREGVLEIGDQVGRVFQPHRQPHHLWRHARCRLLLGIHLRVRRRRWVDGKRLGVAHIRHVREDGEGLDDLLTRLLATLDAEDDHRAALALQILLLQLILLVALEPRVPDPLHLWVALEKLGNCEGVRAVLLHPERQRLDALQEDPRIVWSDGRTKIAQRHGAHAQNERQRRKHLGQVEAPPQPAVRRVGLRVKRVLARAPLERASVNHDSANARSVAAHPLRERVAHDIGTVRDRLRQVRRGEGRVDDEWHPVAVREGRDLLQVGDDARGVGARLTEECARLVVHRLDEILRIRLVDKPHRNAHLWQDVVELRVRAAVQVAARHDIVTVFRHVDDRVKDGRCA
mmetsp:Transcript_31574/g.71332  ORF Transcript_31574/g.71332 Transcript_31574/m.71332 type:complete len:384 (+) Transcript_31574:347-1498(+)